MGLFSYLVSRLPISKEGVAKNALVAKHIFEYLPDDTKTEIIIKTLGVFDIPSAIKGYNVFDDFRSLNEAQFFTFASHAFGMMGIKPNLKGLLFREQWVRHAIMQLGKIALS